MPDMRCMDGEPGCTDSYSIDDVDLMVIALDEWRAAERRISKRKRK